MPPKNGRNVSLTNEQNVFVDRLVESGRYKSASEVVRDGLRLLERDEQEQLLNKWLVEGLAEEEASLIPDSILQRARSEIRAKIQEGLDAARGGDLLDGEQVFRAIVEHSDRKRRTSRK